VSECAAHGLSDVRGMPDCLWEDLGPDETAGEAPEAPQR
jgi:hypothetical protein